MCVTRHSVPGMSSADIHDGRFPLIPNYRRQQLLLFITVTNEDFNDKLDEKR